MKTRVSSKGQIVLPAEPRERDRIEVGQEFEVERLDRGEYRLIRLAAPANEGTIDWLLRCPEKGCFTPKDSLIAATALVHDLAVVTRNVGDFAKANVRVVDPFVST